jgi:hypothetical protein
VSSGFRRIEAFAPVLTVYGACSPVAGTSTTSNQPALAETWAARCSHGAPAIESGELATKRVSKLAGTRHKRTSHVEAALDVFRSVLEHTGASK